METGRIGYLQSKDGALAAPELYPHRRHADSRFRCLGTELLYGGLHDGVEVRENVDYGAGEGQNKREEDEYNDFLLHIMREYRISGKGSSRNISVVDMRVFFLGTG